MPSQVALHSPRIQHTAAPNRVTPSCCGCSPKTKKTTAVALPILLAIILGAATVGIALAGIPIVVVACIGAASLIVLVAATILAKRKISELNKRPMQQRIEANPLPTPINPTLKTPIEVEMPKSPKPLETPKPQTEETPTNPPLDKQTESPKHKEQQPDKQNLQSVSPDPINNTVNTVNVQPPVQKIIPAKTKTSSKKKAPKTTSKTKTTSSPEDSSQTKKMYQKLEKNKLTEVQMTELFEDLTVVDGFNLKSGVFKLERICKYNDDLILNYKILVKISNKKDAIINNYHIIVKNFDKEDQEVNFLYGHPLDRQNMASHPEVLCQIYREFYSYFCEKMAFTPTITRSHGRVKDYPIKEIWPLPSIQELPPPQTQTKKSMQDSLNKYIELIKFWLLINTQLEGCNVKLHDYYRLDSQDTLIWHIKEENKLIAVLRIGIKDKIIADAFDQFPNRKLNKTTGVRNIADKIIAMFCTAFSTLRRNKGTEYRMPSGPMAKVFDDKNRVLQEPISSY